MSDELRNRLDQIAEGQKDRLKRHRVDAGLTQQEVAGAMGVSQQAVARWERENDPGDVWPKLAKLYDVREMYPSAPFNPEKRKAWVEQRTQIIARAKPPRSGTFGKVSRDAA